MVQMSAGCRLEVSVSVVSRGSSAHFVTYEYSLRGTCLGCLCDDKHMPPGLPTKAIKHPGSAMRSEHKSTETSIGAETAIPSRRC